MSYPSETGKEIDNARSVMAEEKNNELIQFQKRVKQWTGPDLGVSSSQVG